MPAKKNDNAIPMMKQLSADLAAGKVYPCYLVYGEESFLIRQVLGLLKKGLHAEDQMNTLILREENPNPETVIGFADTLPLFADRKVVFLEGSGFLKKGNEALEEYLKEIPEEVCFVFSDAEVDKRKTLYKMLAKKAFLLPCDEQSPAVIRQWIASRMKKNGIRMSESAVSFLMGRVGLNMSALDQEMEKLISFTADQKVITEKDVAEICAGWLNGRIFDMMDAVADGNSRKAFSLYLDLLALREAPQKILALLIRQLQLILQAKELGGGGSAHLASLLGIPPFAVDKYRRWGNRYSVKQLQDLLEVCADDDAAVKNGRLNQTVAIEMLLLRCASQKEAGDAYTAAAGNL